MKIAILGARSLSAYTDRILGRGFEAIGWQIVSPAEAEFLLVQLHGAPHAVEDDASVVRLLASFEVRKYGVLIHRPDEIQSRLDLFADKGTLSNAAFIALLGTWHLNDTWLTKTGVPIRAGPHGFVSSKPPPLRTPVVIGSHTRWGEMRRIEDAAALVVELLDRADPGSIVGYLGGEGAENFAPDMQRHEIEVVHDYGMVRGADRKRVLVVNPGTVQPVDLKPILNVQLYHLHGRLRTGENSGSLHQYPSVPVIFEMNGAELMEDLKVIRVPYTNDDRGVCGDFETAADEILNALQTGWIKKALRHNQNRAKVLSPAAVAGCYRDLFHEFAG